MKPREVENRRSIPLSQRDATYAIVVRILQESGIEFTNKRSAKEFLDSTTRKTIYEALEVGLKDGNIFLKPTESNFQKLNDPRALRVYVIGLLNNWIRKDNRLNGSGENKI